MSSTRLRLGRQGPSVVTRSTLNLLAKSDSTRLSRLAIAWMNEGCVLTGGEVGRKVAAIAK
jgi:hypothetical protein